MNNHWLLHAFTFTQINQPKLRDGYVEMTQMSYIKKSATKIQYDEDNTT